MPNRTDNKLTPALAQIFTKAFKNAKNNFDELRKLTQTFTKAKLSYLNQIQEMKGLSPNWDTKSSEETEWLKGCSNCWNIGHNCPNCGRFLC